MEVSIGSNVPASSPRLQNPASDLSASAVPDHTTADNPSMVSLYTQQTVSFDTNQVETDPVSTPNPSGSFPGTGLSPPPTPSSPAPEPSARWTPPPRVPFWRPVLRPTLPLHPAGQSPGDTEDLIPPTIPAVPRPPPKEPVDAPILADTTVAQEPAQTPSIASTTSLHTQTRRRGRPIRAQRMPPRGNRDARLIAASAARTNARRAGERDAIYAMTDCRMFALGKCTYNPCRFLHDESKRPVCRHFSQYQECMFGDDCRYAHIVNEPEMEPETAQTVEEFLLDHTDMPAVAVDDQTLEEGFDVQDMISLLNHEESQGPSPASGEAVQSLERIKITTETVINGDPKCPICMSYYVPDDDLIKMPCQHLFHDECLIQWLNRNNTCPICRLELPVSEGSGQAHAQAQPSTHRPHPAPPPVQVPAPLASRPVQAPVSPALPAQNDLQLVPLAEAAVPGPAPVDELGPDPDGPEPLDLPDHVVVTTDYWGTRSWLQSAQTLLFVCAVPILGVCTFYGMPWLKHIATQGVTAVAGYVSNTGLIRQVLRPVKAVYSIGSQAVPPLKKALFIGSHNATAACETAIGWAKTHVEFNKGPIGGYEREGGLLGFTVPPLQRTRDKIKADWMRARERDWRGKLFGFITNVPSRCFRFLFGQQKRSKAQLAWDACEEAAPPVVITEQPAEKKLRWWPQHLALCYCAVTLVACVANFIMKNAGPPPPRQRLLVCGVPDEVVLPAIEPNTMPPNPRDDRSLIDTTRPLALGDIALMRPIMVVQFDDMHGLSYTRQVSTAEAFIQHPVATLRAWWRRLLPSQWPGRMLYSPTIDREAHNRQTEFGGGDIMRILARNDRVSLAHLEVVVKGRSLSDDMLWLLHWRKWSLTDFRSGEVSIAPRFRLTESPFRRGR